MFKKAVQDHTASAPPPKPQPRSLAQQLFPSSSPSHAAPAAKRKSSTLAPNPSAGNIQPPSSGYRNASNPLKRSATEAARPMAKSQLGHNTSGTGLVSMLHNSVSFDENDFVDDAEIDLDADCDIFPAPKRPCANEANSSANLMQTPATQPTPAMPPPKSTPIDWSSSPPNHKLPPPGTAIPATENDVVKYPTLHEDDVDSLVPRRKLPWLAKEEDASKKGRGAPNGDKPKRGRPRGSSVKDTATTPAGTSAKAPWNMSASAMKAEQQKYRQNKKVKDFTLDADTTTKGRKSNRKGAKPIVLSEEQSKVLALVAEARASVFFTGSAGTGKSVLMREIISTLRTKYEKEKDRVAVTASTGLAACNIGGVTLHSFAGIGLGKEPAEQLVKKIKKQQKTKNRWLRTKVLIIDEISMVDGDLFDKLETVARVIRNNARPFGGIQLVVTGDFFQLPPVPDQGKAAKFCFEAGTWGTSVAHTIGLTQIFRQRDPEFASMLNEMRVGRLSQKSIEVFHSLCRPLKNIKEDQVEVQATELFPTRNEVDNANTMRLNHLKGESVTYDSLDGGAVTDLQFRDRMLSNCMAPPKMVLKKGAQVMLIKNIDETLVNGSIGQVIAFMDEKEFDQHHRAGAEIPGSSTSSYHSRPGGWDSDGEEDPGRGDGASISRAQLHAMVHAQRPGGAGPTAPKWPVVRFPVPGGGSRDLLCQRESWKIELPNGEVQASRSQVPLILAWALSIHKAQGQTLEHVKVDLGKIFEKGQAYVALSRATTQEGLQVLRFDAKKVMAHERVRDFYDKLYNVDKVVGGAGGRERGMQKRLGMDRVEYPDLDEDEYAGMATAWQQREDDAWAELSVKGPAQRRGYV